MFPASWALQGVSQGLVLGVAKIQLKKLYRVSKLNETDSLSMLGHELEGKETKVWKKTPHRGRDRSPCIWGLLFPLTAFYHESRLSSFLHDFSWSWSRVSRQRRTLQHLQGLVCVWSVSNTLIYRD